LSSLPSVRFVIRVKVLTSDWGVGKEMQLKLTPQEGDEIFCQNKSTVTLVRRGTLGQKLRARHEAVPASVDKHGLAVPRLYLNAVGCKRCFWHQEGFPRGKSCDHGRFTKRRNYTLFKLSKDACESSTCPK